MIWETIDNLDDNLTKQIFKYSSFTLLTNFLTIILLTFKINSKFFTLIFNIKLDLIEIKEKMSTTGRPVSSSRFSNFSKSFANSRLNNQVQPMAKCLP